MEIFHKENERIDDLQISLENGQPLKIIQNPSGFCFGTDAVLLSHFAKIKTGSKVLDLCTGSGIIPLLLCAKSKASHITGVEIQPDVADMAKRSVAMNNLEDRIDIICGDLKEHCVRECGAVVCNPPYKKTDSGLISPKNSNAAARSEIFCTLNDVIIAAKKALKPFGSFFMVHRPERITDILTEMRSAGLEPKRLQYVYSSVGKPPVMLLVEGIKDAKPGVLNLAPVFIYDLEGNYTCQIKKIYSTTGC